MQIDSNNLLPHVFVSRSYKVILLYLIILVFEYLADDYGVYATLTEDITCLN